MSEKGMTEQDAARILTEQMYLTVPGAACYLGAFLQMQTERMEIPVSRAECVTTAVWKAWSIQEHFEEGIRTELVTVYVDWSGTEHDHPGMDHSRHALPRPWRTARVPRRHYVKESIVDSREACSGEQTVRKEIFCSSYAGTAFDEWLMDVPASEHREEPCILPNAIESVKKSAEAEAEALCRQAVPGDRFVDLRIQSETAVREWTERIPVFCGRIRINGKERLAYVSALDPGKFLLPELPPTEVQHRIRKQEQELQNKLDEVAEKWDAHDAQLRSAFEEERVSLSRRRARAEQHTAQRIGELERSETSGLGTVLGMGAALAAFAILGLVMLFRMQQGNAVLRFVVMALSFAAVLVIAWAIHWVIRRDAEISEGIEKERKSLREAESHHLRAIRQEEEKNKLSLTDALERSAASCVEEQAKLEASFRNRMETPPLPDPQVLAILRDETLSAPERISRILCVLPDAAEFLEPQI